MNRRLRVLIVFLLSAAMMMTMDSYGFALTDLRSEAYSSEETPSGMLNKMTTEVNGKGWKAESDEESAVVDLVSNSNSVRATISLNNPEIEKYDEREYYTGRNVNMVFYGSTDSSQLEICVSKNSIIHPNTSKKRNTIVIHVDKGNIPGGSIKVKIQKGWDIGSSGDLSGITKETIKLEVGEGVSYREEDLNSSDYIIYSFSNEDLKISENSFAFRKSVKYGDHIIEYYSMVPFMGKSFSPKKYNYYIGKIVLHYKDDFLNMYSDISVTKARLVRLKNVTNDQGAFPTTPNAGIQILQISGERSIFKAKKKFRKELRKKLKKATRISKDSKPEDLLLPVTVYPFRLTEEGLVDDSDSKTADSVKDKKTNKKYHVVQYKEKNGKCTLYIPFRKMVFKNGAKDSFKKGVISVAIDREKNIISANSADLWSGPNGLSLDNSFVKEK